MLRLIRAFAALRGERYHNSRIAKACFTQSPNFCEDDGGETQLCVERDAKNFLLLTAVRRCGRQNTARLSILVLLRGGFTDKTAPPPQPPNGVFWRAFSAAEVRDFAALARDENPIHQTARPIVPGLLLLRDFAAATGARRCEMRFIHPLLADRPLYLEESPADIWHGCDELGPILRAKIER